MPHSVTSNVLTSTGCFEHGFEIGPQLFTFFDAKVVDAIDAAYGSQSGKRPYDQAVLYSVYVTLEDMQRSNWTVTFPPEDGNASEYNTE